MCLLAAAPLLGAAGTGATAAGGLFSGLSGWQAANLAIGIGKTVFGYIGQRQQAKQAEAAYLQDYNNKVATQQLQADQLNAQASEEMTQRARQARIERSRLRVAAGESGVGGLATERLINNASFQEGYDVSRIEANRQNKIKQNNLETKSIHARAQSNLNSISRPSLLGTALQIAGSIGGVAAENEAIKRTG